MTIEQFMLNYNIKSKNTVVSWINNELIPLANLAEDFVPDSARPPYTKARAKNAGAIYKSIINASYLRRHVMPKLYHMSNDEFYSYIERLSRAGLIEKNIRDGITYYDATIDACNYNQDYVLKLVRTVVSAGTEGVVKAMIS